VLVISGAETIISLVMVGFLLTVEPFNLAALYSLILHLST